ARERLALLRLDPETPDHEIDDAGRLAEMLEMVASLPREDQLALADADSLTDVLASLWDEASYAEGVEAARRQLEIRREHLGSVDLDVSESLNELALFLSAMSEHEAAEPHLREALAIDRAILGGEHPVVATSLNNVAMLLREMGHAAKAEPLLCEALNLHRELLGEEHAEVANTMSNLAVALSDQGRFGEAGRLSRKALAIRRKVFPEGHPDIGLSLHNLASTLQNQGDYGRAEVLFREALAISRSLRGDRHPDVAYVKNSLAIVLSYQGMYDEADLLLREALHTLTECFGEKHPEIPLVISNLADVLARRGYPDDAVELLRSELERQIGGGAHEDPRLARTMSSLSVMLGRHGEFVEAEQLERRALGIRRRLLGDAHPDLIRSLHNLGALEWRLGNPAAAESLLVLAAQEFEVARLRAGEGLARSMFLRGSPYVFLAHARLEMGKEVEAWESAERALARSLADMLVAANERQLTETESAREDSLVALIRRLEDEVRTCGEVMQADSTGVLAERYRASRSRLIEVEFAWSDFRQVIAAKYPLSEGEVFSLERIGRSLPEETAVVGWIDLWRGGSEFVTWGYVLRGPGAVVWKPLGQPLSEGDPSPTGRVRKLCSELATP
ncbi:tetratricopeptide repeat protein, partial [bacterium]|nr:tetratricopeptide repeat protein [bacterium]